MADAVEIDVVDSTTIKTEADNRSTTNIETTSTTTGPTFYQLSEASMEMATSATTMGLVMATVVALVSYVVLPGIGPRSSLKHRSTNAPP